MRRFTVLAVFALLAGAPAVAAAQAPTILGTWKLDPKVAKEQKGAPASVIVRADSSASYGKETVRWRLTGKNRISLVLGGEWVEYELKLKRNELTLSGGDLQKPITLKRVGPPTPRPASASIPADPDASAS